jgi:hypothetical protein
VPNLQGANVNWFAQCSSPTNYKLGNSKRARFV